MLLSPPNCHGLRCTASEDSLWLVLWDRVQFDPEPTIHQGCTYREGPIHPQYFACIFKTLPIFKFIYQFEFYVQFEPTIYQGCTYREVLCSYSWLSKLCPTSHLYFRLYFTENFPDLSLSIYILNIKEQPIINQNTYVTSDEERMTNRDMIVPTSSIHPYRVSRLIHLQIQTQTQT